MFSKVSETNKKHYDFQVFSAISVFGPGGEKIRLSISLSSNHAALLETYAFCRLCSTLFRTFLMPWDDAFRFFVTECWNLGIWQVVDPWPKDFCDLFWVIYAMRFHPSPGGPGGVKF